MSCGSRRRIESTIAIVPVGARQRVAGEVVVGVRAPERDVPRRRAIEMTHHDRIVDESDRHVRRSLEIEQAGLGRLVGARRAVPVEVVGREVEPECGVGAELFRPRQAEAAALDDVGVELHLERVDKWNVGVAGRDRAHASGGQHRRREQRRGRLAVGPRDGEDRSGAAGSGLLPLVGELDLAPHGYVVASCGRDHAVRLGHTRRRRHEIEAGDEGVDRDRCREQLDAELVGEVALGVVDVVVDDDDLVAAPGRARGPSTHRSPRGRTRASARSSPPRSG